MGIEEFYWVIWLNEQFSCYTEPQEFTRNILDVLISPMRSLIIVDL